MGEAVRPRSPAAVAVGATGAALPAPTAAPVRRAMLSYVPGVGSSPAEIHVFCLGGETYVENKAGGGSQPERLCQLAEAGREAGGRPVSLIWHSRGVPVGERAEASGRLCSTPVGCLSGDVRGLEREQVVQQRAPVGERRVLPLHRAEQQVVVVVRQLVRARVRVGLGLDLVGVRG